MKLYETHRGAYFQIVEATTVPPSAPQVSEDEIYRLNTLDGMYSNCSDSAGNIVHIAAFTEVRTVPKPVNFPE